MPLFHSPNHAGFRLLIRSQYDRRHPTTGDIIQTDEAIWADFGKPGQEMTWVHPETGESHTGAQVIGHYYDTDAEAVERGWDQDTHDFVVRRLRDAIRREPYRLQEIDRDVAKAGLPWPTYDDCDAHKVLELAPALGLVQEALAYERENKQRKTVLDGLTDTGQPEDGDPEDETPLPPAAKAEPVAAGSRTITV